MRRQKAPLQKRRQPRRATHRWCRACGGLVPRIPKRHKHQKRLERRKKVSNTDS